MKKQRVQCGVTAGLAIVGASVIAVAPMAPTASRVVEQDVVLTSALKGSPEVLLAMTGGRLAEQLVQAPFIPLVLAAAVAGQDNDRLYSSIKQILDAPLYVADPTIEAIAATLPESAGGGSDHDTQTSATDGQIMQFRNQLIDDLRAFEAGDLADALGPDHPGIDENFAWELANAVQASLVRTVTGAALGALGPVQFVQDVADGDSVNVAAYKTLRAYNDAPLWAADPTIDALGHALPTALGGDTPTYDINTGKRTGYTDGALSKVRDETLWSTTRDAKVALAKALNVDTDSDGHLPGEPGYSGVQTFSRSATSSLSTQGTDIKSKVSAEVKKVSEKVKATVKKLTSKPDTD